MGKGNGSGEGSGGMLQAQKNALRAVLTENVITLQQQELTYFYNNFSNISTMAAIIGGFAFSGLTISTTYTGWLTHLDTASKGVVCVVYYVCASLAIGFCMLTCIICTALNVRGPGLALRGPEVRLSLFLACRGSRRRSREAAGICRHGASITSLTDCVRALDQYSTARCVAGLAKALRRRHEKVSETRQRHAHYRHRQLSPHRDDVRVGHAAPGSLAVWRRSLSARIESSRSSSNRPNARVTPRQLIRAAFRFISTRRSGRWRRPVAASSSWTSSQSRLFFWHFSAAWCAQMCHRKPAAALFRPLSPRSR